MNIDSYDSFAFTHGDWQLTVYRRDCEVGAVGMCCTGVVALAMMPDPTPGWPRARF